MAIRDTLTSLAEKFADDILTTIRGASVDDLLGGDNTPARTSTRAPRTAAPRAPKAPTARKGGRLARRSDEEIGGMVTKIVALLAKNPDGLRAEQIREKLGVDAKELPRPLAAMIKSRQAKKTGQKRATLYSVGGGAKVKTVSKANRTAKKTAKVKRSAKKRSAKKPAAKKPAAKATPAAA